MFPGQVKGIELRGLSEQLQATIISQQAVIRECADDIPGALKRLEEGVTRFLSSKLLRENLVTLNQARLAG